MERHPGMLVSPHEVRDKIDAIFREESRRVFATLIRLLGDFDLAEDALHDAFASALQQWIKEGIPSNPTAWLVSAGRFKAIDAIRRRAKFDDSLAEIAAKYDQSTNEVDHIGEQAVKDDQLRLIFTCCHPALSPEARTALTLREVCGLTTEEIARAYLTNPPTIAQRIVRAKSKIRSAKIPYQVPEEQDLPERLETALQVVYLLFNEGYYASSGADFVRTDLSKEAIRLARSIADLMPTSETRGLLALMLLHESRRIARVGAEGQIVLLDDQDRTLWDEKLIDEGKRLVEESLKAGDFGSYSLQAAIAAVHADSKYSGRTDWHQIANLYDLLLQRQRSPIVELNRAVAIAMWQGPEAGLALIDGILGRGELEGYLFAYSAKADLLRRLGRNNEAIENYRKAADLAELFAEKEFLANRLAELEALKP